MKKKIQSLISFRPNSKQLANRLLYELTKPSIIVPYRPIWLLLYTTDACNLRCTMCPHHTPHNVNDFAYLKKTTYTMPLTLLDEVIARFPEAMVASMAGVGEPTMHPKFPQLLEKLAHSNMIIDLTTNGYFLNGEKLDALVENFYVREVSISLNGSSCEEHHNITNRSGFERVTNNIRALVDRRKQTNRPIRISISQICTNDNSHLWGSYIDLATALGVDRLYLHNVIDMNIQAQGLKTLSSADRLKDKIKNLPTMNGNLEIIKPVLIKDFNGSPKCQWFFKNLAFDAGGNLGSCGRVMNPQPEYGSICSDEDIWNNDYMQNLRATFLDYTGSSLKKVCTKCVENFQ